MSSVWLVSFRDMGDKSLSQVECRAEAAEDAFDRVEDEYPGCMATTAVPLAAPSGCLTLL